MSVPQNVHPQIGIQLLDQGIAKGSPFVEWQYLRAVTFNSTANNDTDIKHSLKASNQFSNNVDFWVLNQQLPAAPGTVPTVYRNSAGTARPWGVNYIVLRCNVASFICDILLTVARPNAAGTSAVNNL